MRLDCRPSCLAQSLALLGSLPGLLHVPAGPVRSDKVLTTLVLAPLSQFLLAELSLVVALNPCFSDFTAQPRLGRTMSHERSRSSRWRKG